MRSTTNAASANKPPQLRDCVLLCALIAFGAESVQADVIERDARRGPVTVKVRLEPAKPRIGDPVTLTLAVTAPPEVELLMPDFGEALDRFTILDFVPRERIDGDGNTVAEQTYRLQPSASGNQAIPPILVEFVDRREGQRAAPDEMDAYELLTPRVEFEVESVIPAGASPELRPPRPALQPLSNAPTQRRIGIAVLVAVILAALPFVYRYLHKRQQLARRRTAYEIARSRLDRLKAMPTPTEEEIDAFFVELSGLIRQYLEDRFELRAPDLTTEEFLESVSDSPDMSSEHQALLRQFLRQADLVKFAGVRPTQSGIAEALEAASQFLDETQENAPLIDEGVRSLGTKLHTS